MSDFPITQTNGPLTDADTLLDSFIRIGLASDETALSNLCVVSAAQLSGCELSQLYLLDETTARPSLVAQHLPALSSSPHRSSGEDLKEQQLLSYVLERRIALCIDDLACSPYDAGFLPSAGKPWRSVLTVPLFDRRKVITGVLLCASWRPSALQDHTVALGRLGSFALNQLLMVRCMQLAVQCERLPCAEAKAPSLGLIGSSAAIEETCHLIAKVLHTPYTVLLQGETGTGKEVVARAIHLSGPRSGKAFVVQNCAAFPEGLLESELFGYRKGAFTGAERNYTGLFDAADGGTLLLDEIGDMPLSLQAKLLRVLQESEVRPLGASAAHKVDVRIIAATHRDLAAMVAQGSFREDLYYRLAQFPIQLPALRERDGDVLQLARHFTQKACASLGRASLEWSGGALDQLSSHHFPGNVRELKCLVERAVLMCEGDVILPAHLSLPHPSNPVAAAEATLRQRMERVERVVLIDCLHKNRGNRTRTARELGVARRTLLYRLARLNIPFDDAKGER